MKVIGLFKELDRECDQSVQTIDAAVGGLPAEQVDAVVRYLKNGVPVFDVMGTSVDPFDVSVHISGGPSLVSDGRWVWRQDLAYFVEKYKVSLPDEFVGDALRGRSVKDQEQSIILKWKDAVDAYEAASRGER